METKDYSVNRTAVVLIKVALARADELNNRVSRSASGATMVDIGFDCPGGWEAGRIFAEAQAAALGMLGRMQPGVVMTAAEVKQQWQALRQLASESK